ncbi:testis-expressed protein 12 isoform X2 [Corvus kubaryi]|uniref:testis-expressed protein 12 isoform X2 n=1 Tax=Corvus kubaryi TaxID=68294 RepID=UPI001C046D9C|nr:testis-expressed protein 12 isoform X2 [Corvus kubaryi]
MASDAQKADKNRNRRKKTENEASEIPQFSDKTDLAPSEDSQSLSNTEPLEKVLHGDVLNLLKRWAKKLIACYQNMLTL